MHKETISKLIFTLDIDMTLAYLLIKYLVKIKYLFLLKQFGKCGKRSLVRKENARIVG